MYLQKEQTWPERQAQAEANLMQLEETMTSFMAPHVVSNPYGIAPLTAMVLFKT